MSKVDSRIVREFMKSVSWAGSSLWWEQVFLAWDIRLRA